MLILTALIWGSAFVAQKSGMELLGPLSFNCIRLFIGGTVLIPVIKILNKFNSGKNTETNDNKTLEEKRNERKTLFIGGASCGIVLMIAACLQQTGLMYTTAGKGGFITALYVILVPIFGLFLGKKVRPILWLCVVASAIGLYLLCMPAGGGFGELNTGDLLVALCAIFFALHIMVIDHFSPKVDGVKMSCIQFFVAGFLSLLFIWIDPLIGYSLPTVDTVLASWLPIMYVGVLSCGAAYTLQIVAQADTDPTIASMILCLESVFAVLAGIVLLGEAMSLRETFGCIIMFAAIIVAQLPGKPKENNNGEISG